MFPLSCARVPAHTGRETSAHKKTSSAHKCYLQICLLHIFHTRHSKFRRVQVKSCTKEILREHRLKRIRGTLGNEYDASATLLLGLGIFIHSFIRPFL